jgi:pilus assembly protein CpaF
MMKDAPIIQIIADNEKLKYIAKNLLRSDADYFIMAEARDGIALDTVVKIASKGTRRMKSTFHARDPLDFCYDVAGEIIKSFGGNRDDTAVKAAKSFDYIFHFIQLKNKSQKRLKGIYEMYVDPQTKEIVMTQICSYSFECDSWNWIYAISEDKRLSGKEENAEAFNRMSEALMMLSKLKEGNACE